MAEPWGGPDRRELLGELVACQRLDGLVAIAFGSPILRIDMAMGQY